MKSAAYKISRPRYVEMPSGALFNDARAKLNWARMHAYNVSQFWESFVNDYYASPERFKQKAPHVRYNPLHVPVAVEIPLMIGDCVHNLRNALDHLVSAMARKVNLPDNNIIFPFAEKADGLQASFQAPKPGDQHRKGRRAGALYELSTHYPELENLILQRIRPYSKEYGGGDLGDTIWRINDANNIDKHRLITPTTNNTGIERVVFDHGDGKDITLSGFSVIGGPAFSPDINLKDNADFTVDILFEEPTRFAHRPVTRTLVSACDFVGETISIFAETFE